MDYPLVLPIAVAGLLLLCFKNQLIKLYNPFYGSRLKTVMKCQSQFGETIYIFRWRPQVEKDDTPVWEMGKCGIAFVSEEDLRGLVNNPQLLKSYSISTWNGCKVTTLDVNYILPHEVYTNHRIPNNSMDLYAGIRTRRLTEKSQIEQPPSTAEVRAG